MKAIKKFCGHHERLALLIAMGALIGIGYTYEHFTGRKIEAVVCTHVGGGMSVCPK